MARAKKSEFGLESIFDNVRDGLVLVRFPRREIVLFNRSASDITGIPVDKALGTRLDHFFTEPKVLETARICSQQPVGVWPGHAHEIMQTHIQGRNAHEEAVEVHFCRVDNVGRGGPLVLLVIRPSSHAELEHVAKQGDTAQRRVEALEADVREHAVFFSEAAHEFNTPLTVLALQADLLRGALGPVEPAQERALGIISANVHRLVLLSQDLADLASADSGRLILKTEQMDVVKLAKEEVANFEALATQQGLTIDFAASEKRATVVGEPSRLRQALSNLLDNAIKFTPRGGSVSVEVSATAEEASIRVRDTGPGMDAEDQARLFQPFIRVTSPHAPKKPGTGLGLYLSKRIVEAHGGQIGCSSPGRGKGMTFWVKIPLARPARTRRAPSRARRSSSRPIRTRK